MLPRILLLVTLFVTCEGIEARPSVETILPSLVEYMEKYRPIFENMAGSGIVVVKDGKVILKKGMGTLATDDPTPVDEHTVFALASGSKNFAATLMMCLVHKGVISLDDKVTKYLPHFKIHTETEAVTVRHLLSHCVGLPGFSGDSLWYGRLSQEEILNHLKDIPLEAEPGKKYTYSNIFVGIAGLVMEKATGKPYDQLVEEELLIPLGMTETSVGVGPMMKELSLIDRFIAWCKYVFLNEPYVTKAAFHALKHGKAEKIPYYPEFYLFPASTGINTTLHDMGKWLLFQLNKGRVGETQLIPKELMETMRQGFVDGTEELHGEQFSKDRMNKITLGLGWFNQDYGVADNRIQTHLHMGGLTGSRTLLVIVPEENMGVAIFANVGGMRANLFPEAIVNKFLDLYLGIEKENDGAQVKDWAHKIHEKFLKNQNKMKLSYDALRLKNPRPAAPLLAYTGTFENTIYGTVKIVEKNHRLVLTYREREVPLQHWNGDSFVFPGNALGEAYAFDDRGLVEFGLDRSGQAFGVMISSMDEGENPVFYRKG